MSNQPSPSPTPPENTHASTSLAAECQKIQNLLAQQQLEQAFALCKELIKQNPDNPQLHMLYGIAYHKHNNLPAAENYLSKAVELAPDSLQYRQQLYHFYTTERSYYNARNCLKHIIQHFPETVNNTAYKALGDLHMRLAEFDDALATYEQALTYDQTQWNIYESMANAYLHKVDIEEAQKILDRAEAINTGITQSFYTNAVIKFKQGKFDEALVSFQHLLSLPDQILSRLAAIHRWLGKIYEKQGNYDQAFEHFTQSQITAKQEYDIENRHKQSLNDLYPAIIHQVSNWLTPDAIASWSKDIPDDTTPAPLFIVGVPRSGTTLTEQILACHPNITTLSEQIMLTNAIKHLGTMLSHDFPYPEVLNHLNSEHISQLRQAYMQQASQLLNAPLGDKLLVDKFPMHIVHLNLIYRIFPDARIVVLLRDPRDVCLSCYTQLFDYNLGMQSFFLLDRTVKTYTQIMELYLKARDILPANRFELYYEDLVSDLEPNARKLLDFTGQPWDNNVLHYHTKENKRYYKTPSYEAVTQPTYQDAIGKWKNYRKYLEPYLETLQPFIEAFGYDHD